MEGCNRKAVNVKKCDAGSDKTSKMNHKNTIIVSIMYMIVTMFFWYFALNNIWFYLYNTAGFTITGSIFGTIISVISGLVYAYLIYDVVKVEKFNFVRSTILVVAVIILSIISIFIFPIPVI